MDPGYSTVGDLQSALNNIVRTLSVLLQFQQCDSQAHHERVLKVLSEDGETPPNWLAHCLLCRW